MYVSWACAYMYVDVCVLCVPWSMCSSIPSILVVWWETVGVAFDQLLPPPPSSGNPGGGVRVARPDPLSVFCSP